MERKFTLRIGEAEEEKLAELKKNDRRKNRHRGD